jgi:hypothetical protein
MSLEYSDDCIQSFPNQLLNKVAESGGFVFNGVRRKKFENSSTIQKRRFELIPERGAMRYDQFAKRVSDLSWLASIRCQGPSARTKGERHRLANN